MTKTDRQIFHDIFKELIPIIDEFEKNLLKFDQNYKPNKSNLSLWQKIKSYWPFKKMGNKLSDHLEYDKKIDLLVEDITSIYYYKLNEDSNQIRILFSDFRQKIKRIFDKYDKILRDKDVRMQDISQGKPDPISNDEIRKSYQLHSKIGSNPEFENDPSELSKITGVPSIENDKNPSKLSKTTRVPSIEDDDEDENYEDDKDGKDGKEDVEDFSDPALKKGEKVFKFDCTSYSQENDKEACLIANTEEEFYKFIDYKLSKTDEIDHSSFEKMLVSRLQISINKEENLEELAKSKILESLEELISNIDLSDKEKVYELLKNLSTFSREENDKLDKLIYDLLIIKIKNERKKLIKMRLKS